MTSKFNILVEHILLETPDSVDLPNGETGNVSSSDSITFLSLNSVIYYTKNHTHAELFKNMRQWAKGNANPIFKTFGGSHTPQMLLQITDKLLQSPRAQNGVRYITDAPGRLWINSKVISFWNTQDEVKPMLNRIQKFLIELGQNPSEYKFEFINSKNLMSSQDAKGQSGSDRDSRTINQLKAKAHVSPLGNKWASAIRKL